MRCPSRRSTNRSSGIGDARASQAASSSSGPKSSWPTLFLTHEDGQTRHRERIATRVRSFGPATYLKVVFWRSLSAISLALLMTAGVGNHPAHAAPGLTLGFNDLDLVQKVPDERLREALPRAADAGAGVFRFQFVWRQVAPVRPPSLSVARDPAWPGYNWTETDRVARAITDAGLDPVPFIYIAPAWAEGPDRPAVSRFVPLGTWRPDPSHFGAFATAVARRYSGTFPDPLVPGQTLPRIKWFQAWNEPNLYNYLTPQWTKRNDRWDPASPTHYRRMANAFYAGIKRGHAAARVLSAGTAPFGDLEDGDPRMAPVRFWRELLCVRQANPVSIAECGQTVRFDAVAHHPYPIGPPRRKARNADDVVVPDLRKITRLFPAALRAGTLAPRGTKPLWVTEISWDTEPDPDGVSLAEQATYLEAALYILWQQGTDVVTWWQFRDEASTPSFASTFQSGIFFRGSTPLQDQPKPSYTAFRFPFTAYRTNGVARLWGKTPGDRAVTIQAQQGGRWVTAARLNAGSNRIFTGRLRVGPNTPLRAVAGTDISLTWRTQ